MLELTGFHCTLPGQGPGVSDLSLSLDPGTITAVVGRSGSGGATLVRALSGDLPPGTHIRGVAAVGGQRIDGATRDELAGTVLWLSDEALPGGTVADCLRMLTGDLSSAADVGLADELSRRVTSLPIDLRLRLHCASLLARRGDAAVPLVLVDRVLGAADAATRDRFCGLLRDRARSGAPVLWAEHDLDAVWGHAGQIVEFVDGHIQFSGAPVDWQPSTLPEPTLRAVARALELPFADCRTPQTTAGALMRTGRGLPLFPTRSPQDAAPTGSGIVVDPATLGVSGPAIEILPGECVGIVDVGDRPEGLARRLIRKLPGGESVPSQLPGTLRVGAAARVWERRHRLPTGSVLGHLPGVRPRTLLVDLTPGARAGFRQALARGVRTPLWLSHPQADLDPRDRHALAEDLRRRPAGIRLITSRDVEFLVRACHRLVVVRDGRVIGEGYPGAVVDLLPVKPLVSRAVGSTRYLRLTDVLVSTGSQVPV